MVALFRAIVLVCLAAIAVSLRMAPAVHLRVYEKNGLKARAIVVSCMDFRLINKVKDMMISRGYSDNYDFFVLAGAALGYVQKKMPAWQSVLHDHLHYAIALHHVREVIFVDHLDCGLYKQTYGLLKGK
jgi:carbonic anhydrase